MDKSEFINILIMISRVLITSIQRTVSFLLLPFYILNIINILTLATSISAIFILKSTIDTNIDFIRSFPIDPEVIQIFWTARSLFYSIAHVISVFSTIILGVSVYLILFRNHLINKFNLNIIEQYKTDEKPVAKLCFLLLLAILLAALSLPYISYLLISPWPLVEERAVISSADKRWFIILYNIIWFIPLFLIPLLNTIANWVYDKDKRLSWKIKNINASSLFKNDISFRNNYVLLLLAIFIAWLLYGIPWNIDLLVRPLNSHIFYSIVTYQAIDTGYIPYVGPASFGYGPGTQLLVYIYQKINGGLSIISFRESYAFLNWIAATIYFSFTLLMFGYLRGFIIILLSIIISPLTFFMWNHEGILQGLFGWSNALRYIAIPVVTLLTVRVVAFSKSDSDSVRSSLVIGFFWGLMAYISQENGILTLLSVMTVLLAALSGRLINLMQSVKIILSLLSGVLIFFTPILVFYFINGYGMEFLENYRHVPGYVYNGITCMYWNPNNFNNYFWFMPVLALLLGMGCFLRLRPLGLVTELSITRLVLLAAVLSVILGHMSSVIRTADSQSVNSMIGTPILFALMLYLPFKSKSYKNIKGLLIIPIVLLILAWMIPNARNPVPIYSNFVSSRIQSFSLFFKKRNEITIQKQNDHRLPESVLKLDECCYRPIGLSGRDLENIANNLKVVLGDRYVHFDSFPTLRAPGILLYLGDIRPSHTYRDMPGYFPTVRSRITYKWATIAKIDEINTMVTADLTRPVPKALLKFYPNANVREFLSKVGKYYVITI